MVLVCIWIFFCIIYECLYMLLGLIKDCVVVVVPVYCELCMWFPFCLTWCYCFTFHPKALCECCCRGSASWHCLDISWSLQVDKHTLTAECVNLRHRNHCFGGHLRLHESPILSGWPIHTCKSLLRFAWCWTCVGCPSMHLDYKGRLSPQAMFCSVHPVSCQRSGFDRPALHLTLIPSAFDLMASRWMCELHFEVTPSGLCCVCTFKSQLRRRHPWNRPWGLAAACVNTFIANQNSVTATKASLTHASHPAVNVLLTISLCRFLSFLWGGGIKFHRSHGLKEATFLLPASIHPHENMMWEL